MRFAFRAIVAQQYFMEQTRLSFGTTRIRFLAVAMLICALLGATWLLSYRATEQFARAALERDAALFATSLTARLNRFDHLAPILARDPDIRQFWSAKDLLPLNQKLRDAANDSALEAIYLMDENGLTVAASNFEAPVTFLGKNYGFRPYFQDAVRGDTARFFAVGATTQRPGVFLATPVRDEGTVFRGVLALKHDLSQITEGWNDAPYPLFVTNAAGVVVLASDPAWLYRTTKPIDSIQKAQIASTRQFGPHPLMPLGWRFDLQEVLAEGVGHIHAAEPLPILGWTLHHMRPLRTVRVNAWQTTALAALALGLIGAFYAVLRARRVRLALNESQKERRALRTMNTALESEIEDRRAAERRLETAQAELARSSRLAALGQLSASVTHELGQPLSAMKNHIAAAELNPTRGEQVLGKLSGLVRRMESITTDLRFFAKPGDTQLEHVDLNEVAQGALELTQVDFEVRGVALEVAMASSSINVRGNRLRLEQVVVNLLKNAMRAVQDADNGTVHLTVKDDGIVVTDNGPGLAGKTLEALSEPFYTTSASGMGMGLGLAISAAIAKDHGGWLKARDTGHGAQFALVVPLEEPQT